MGNVCQMSSGFNSGVAYNEGGAGKGVPAGVIRQGCPALGQVATGDRGVMRPGSGAEAQTELGKATPAAIE